MSNGCFNALLPIFLLFVFGTTYYFYIYHYCLGVIKNLHNRIVYIVLLNIITVMFLWSFFATMWSSVGRVPNEYKFTRTQHNALLKARSDDDRDDILERFCEAKNLLLHTCTPTGSIRYCVTCMHIKPDRAHHCATCKICFLKMDHHCPWINNCIGYRNYKHFLLLVFYTCLYCFYFVCSTIQYIISTIDNVKYGTDIPISIGFGLAVIMGLVTFGFLSYHLYLVGRNETTLENVHSPNFVEDDLTFDLGVRNNVIEVFGDRWYLWFLPVFSSMGCGHMFLVERK